jgi:hypothetical protein
MKGCRGIVTAALRTAVLVLVLAPAPVLATGINFADLGPDCSPPIPAPYHGLVFSPTFQVECNADYSSSYGNSYGAPSGYAVTNGGAPGSGLVSISAARGTFDFLGARFSSFAGGDSFQSYSAGSLQVFAYRPGDAPDSPSFLTTFDLAATQYESHIFGWTGIGSIYFGAGNGVSSDPYTTFGFDGLSWLVGDVETGPTPVPEPASLGPMLLGLAGASWALSGRCGSAREKRNRRL